MIQNSGSEDYASYLVSSSESILPRLLRERSMQRHVVQCPDAYGWHCFEHMHETEDLYFVHCAGYFVSES